MRYLLLSVLVVCVIGVMVPSAFGQLQDQKFYHKVGGGGFTHVSFDVPKDWKVIDIGNKRP